MNLQGRKDLLVQLGHYMMSSDELWKETKEKAFMDNNWFTNEFVDLAVHNISNNFLNPDALQKLMAAYAIPDVQPHPKKVGIVMAGNIPLVGFHDFLCVFLSGHIAVIKPSSKDEILIRHLIRKLTEWEPEVEALVQLQERLNNCDAYIATGSNNTSRYFEYYFKKYPHLIRKNRTSVAVLTGAETAAELEKLADDVHQYFGLGCRNITKLYVPEGYDFIPLLEAFNKYHYFIDRHKYKNNYDYNLAMHILNNRFYMTNGSMLLVEEASPFSRISQLHYEYYKKREEVLKNLSGNEEIQCVVGKDAVPFGEAQCPAITDFADKVDTMQFLLNL